MTVALAAPLAGWLGPLAEIPDAAFADGMVGDGVAIDPTGSSVHAPCAATVVAVAATRHAVTLRTAAGAELLIHVGIDTVALAGSGFTTHVAADDRVAAGDLLISFDLDILARGASSLMTPVVVINGDAFAFVPRRDSGPVAVGDLFGELLPLAPSQVVATAGPTVSATAVVAAEHGIHARPAAAIAAATRRFDAAVELSIGDRRADARSSVAVLTLGLPRGARVGVAATGSEAAAAVAALVALIERSEAAAASPPLATPTVAGRADVPAGRGGVPAAPGLAVGIAVRLETDAAVVASEGTGIDLETARLASAVADVRRRLTAIAAGSGAAAGIAAAHLDLLDDTAFADAAAAALGRGLSAAAAWQCALDPAIAALADLADPRLAARADDLRDLRAQVVAAASGRTAAALDLPDDAIVVAENLLPSQLLALDRDRLAGIVLAGGGPTAHVAIMAAAQNVPMIVACGPEVLAIAAGTRLIVDADAGSVTVDPDQATIAAARARLAERTAVRVAARAAADTDCYTADGRRIEIFANLGSVADAEAAVAAGAEGCGLLRTELLFLDRATPPGVAEQVRHYQAVASALAGRPLILRTLDIGGDKPAPYMALPAEENPALGLRGVRVSLARPEMLRDQLRAALAVTPQPRLLLPMIASVAELVAVREQVDAVTAEIGCRRPSLGVMIETPAAAVTADLLAAHADFFAIGTNDLSQYVLAMDRGNPAVAGGIDALHPAVLRLIAQTCAGAATHGRPVGVCGGLASDFAATAILIGLGVGELSAVPALVPELKALVRRLDSTACAELARAALGTESAAAVRALVGGMAMSRPRFSTAGLQALGRALMLPIAVLPVAGILLRLGQPDLLDIAFVAAAGDAIFKNLGLLFAIGVAVGFARDGNGAAGLAGVVGFLVATHGAEALIEVPATALVGMSDAARPLAVAAFRAAALAKLSVPLGILSGVIAGQAYNRFGTVRLPEYLAFFGGRRFVPIVSGLAGVGLALVFGLGFTTLDRGIDGLSRGVAAAGPAGLFAYGLLNRLLLVTGLHHILNNIVWFILGNFHGATGDLNRFFAGDPTAGKFMAGFFPVMIFGLPAACLAMYHAVAPARRAQVGGLFLSLALTAMLTGVTEPIEFTFMFLAPVLFVLHAVLTGAAMVIMDLLGVKLGFGFSAGLLDYGLNFGRATRPLLLVPVGLVYAAVYYTVFRWVIIRFDLKTPGRDIVAATRHRR